MEKSRFAIDHGKEHDLNLKRFFTKEFRNDRPPRPATIISPNT